MAVVSEGTFYQAKIAPSYVSSSGYYGYVPPCPIADYENVVVHQHQFGRVGEANGQASIAAKSGGGLSWSLSVPNTIEEQQQQQLPYQQQQQQLICFNGSAMETDDDDNSRRDYVRVSRCENNRCVIPEAAGMRPEGGVAGYESTVYRVSQHDDNSAVTARRRGNRKRNSAGDPAYLFAGHPASSKKSRQDGGNGNVRHDAGSSGKRGSPTLHYEPSSLSHIGDVGFCWVSSKFSGSKRATISCGTTVGNYDTIDETDLERPCIVESNDDDKFPESYLDYERMLMETHGCSAYHYHCHRHKDIGVLEAEF